MADNNPTYEQLDSAFKNAAGAAKEGAGGIGDLCKIWPPIKMILEIILNFPIPEPWKVGIRAFIKIVDALCSGGPK